jgi:hypothetical protein
VRLLIGLVLVVSVGLLVAVYVGWLRPPAAALVTAPRSVLTATGRNPYWVLEPGYRQTFVGADQRQLVVTVLDRTEPVDGVLTRVVEERETKGAALVELSHNYFAIDATTHDIYYFGEDVDNYTQGVVTHPGSWRSGVGGAHYGLMMPARPRVGFRHQQEIAPGVAQDQAQIVSLTETVAGPSGPWHDCVEVAETDPRKPETTEYKYYAPDVGLVRDDDLALVSYGPTQ